MKKRVRQFNEKIGVLEIEKHSQIEQNTQQQQCGSTRSNGLPMNGIGKDEINDSRNDDQSDERTTRLIKKVQRKEAEHISTHGQSLAQQIIQNDEGREKVNKEPVVEQQRVLRVVEQLLAQGAYVKSGQGFDFDFLFSDRRERT